MIAPNKRTAKALGLKRYFTGKPCKRGHVAERYTQSGNCLTCHFERNAACDNANPAGARERARRYAARNREKERQRHADARRREPEKHKAKVARWWANNPHKVHEIQSRRRARKREAIPPDFGDFDEFVIQEAHAACKRREAMTGYKWNVDHMIPLARGGLHKFDNIQVIPQKMNFSKRDRLILTRPGEWVRFLPGGEA